MHGTATLLLTRARIHTQLERAKRMERERKPVANDAAQNHFLFRFFRKDLLAMLLLLLLSLWVMDCVCVVCL